MHNYNDVNAHLPLAATTDKKGKALLSWRVALLPYLEEQELYKQFKLDEPWDSAHNKKLLSKMPAVFAPPGVKTRQPFTTFYQVFVSARTPARAAPQGMPRMPGMPGMPGAAGRPGGQPMAPGMPGAYPGGPEMPGPPSGGLPSGMMPGTGGAAGDSGPTAAFVKGAATRFPAEFPDGTSNTILVIEAGNPVPWTKPEDLHYAEDEPLPELGGLFPDAIHALFADGAVHTLRRSYVEKHLRYAITRDDGEALDLPKIEAQPHRATRGRGSDAYGSSVKDWQRKNESLRKEVEQTHERIQLLKRELEVERELASEDPRLTQLKEEHARLQAELKKLRAVIDTLNAELHQMQRPEQRKNP
jgi:hypothetical protein